MKKLIVFDLDGTLAPSKSMIDREMARLLGKLTEVARVAIISGGAWKQFDKQVIKHLPERTRLANLSILPTCGTQFYEYRRGWKKLYSEDFTPAESAKIKDALGLAIEKAHFKPEKHYGEVIEDRGSQITFSALGQQAPLDKKVAWDPDLNKRKLMQKTLSPMLRGFSVRIGGSTSIDVTRKGIDKGYGIRKLRDILHIGIPEMVFVGDALFKGGNDYPAKQAGADSIHVKDPEETKRVIETTICLLSG